MHAFGWKRERVVALAAEHDFWVFEDDPYRALPFGEDPPPTMLSTDEAGRVIHASSFSKTRQSRRPGRLPDRPRGGDRALAARTRSTSPQHAGRVDRLELCRSGALERNIEFVKGALRERRDALVSALRSEIPEAKFVEPGGGYFLWLTLEGEVDTARLVRAAEEEGVVFIPGPDFMLEGGRYSLRLSFASVPPERIGEGVERIAKALERVRAATPA